MDEPNNALNYVSDAISKALAGKRFRYTLGSGDDNIYVNGHIAEPRPGCRREFFRFTSEDGKSITDVPLNELKYMLEVEDKPKEAPE